MALLQQVIDTLKIPDTLSPENADHKRKLCRVPGIFPRYSLFLLPRYTSPPARDFVHLCGEFVNHALLNDAPNRGAHSPGGFCAGAGHPAAAGPEVSEIGLQLIQLRCLHMGPCLAPPAAAGRHIRPFRTRSPAPRRPQARSGVRQDRGLSELHNVLLRLGL